MNAKSITAIVALAIACAAFAGVAVSADDSDAAVTEVTVSYDVEGVTYTDSAKAAVGSNYAIKSLEELKATAPAGEKFVNWIVKGDASGAKYVPGTTYAVPAEPTADIIVFEAVFEKIAYTITFTADGATVGTVTGNIDGAISAPKVPAKAGYIAQGWYLSTDEAKALVDFSKVKITGDAAYIALYTVDFKVSFDISGSYVNEGTVSKYVIPGDPSKDGYTFLGWSADGGKTVLDAAGVKEAIKSIQADTVYVAIFEPVNHTVTFVANGEVVLPVQTVLHNALVTEPKTVPVKEGSDFSGWVVRTVTTDAEGKEVVTETPFDFATPITSDLTITASFTATPEPEKTGLSNPVILSAVIIAVLIVGFVLAVLVLKKDVIRSKLATRLAAKEGDKKA